MTRDPSLTPAETFNEQQRARWGGVEGEYWARQQDRLDRMLAPVIRPLLEFAAPVVGSTVIDVGCGCGATTVELARAVGPEGRVVALELSEPMLKMAEQRLQAFANARCMLGDAAELPLGGLDAELMVSRFGVMFFGDPVAAFANLRTGLAPGGRLRFACWRPMGENPWSQVPLHAVYEHTPRLPKPDPEEPGPFSFGDIGRVTRVLMAAGFDVPSFSPLNIGVDLAGGGSVVDAAIQATEMGAAKRALADQPDGVRAAAMESVRRALEPFASSTGVKVPGAVWLVAADRSS
jgi:SAM-dependent methyltransferase